MLISSGSVCPNQFITCASDRTVHGPYSISLHPTPHALPHTSVCIKWHAPLIPAFRSQRQVGLWIGSKPGLHREVQDSWDFLGPVSKTKRKVLPFCPEEQMNLTWSSLKTRSQVVRTNIPRWSLVPSEKGLLAPGGGGRGRECLFSIPWYLLPGSGNTHTSHGHPRNQISILGVNPRYSRPHMKPTWHWRSGGSAFIGRVVVSFPFSFCLFFFKALTVLLLVSSSYF